MSGGQATFRRYPVRLGPIGVRTKASLRKVATYHRIELTLKIKIRLGDLTSMQSRTNSLMNSAPSLTRRRTPQRPHALALFSRNTGLEGNVSLKRQGRQQSGDKQSI